MEFKFSFREEIERMVKNSVAEKIDVNKLKGFYCYHPDESIVINLGADDFTEQSEHNLIDNITGCLYHEYLHKSIRNMQKDLGIIEEFESKHYYEEVLVADIVNERFNSKEYGKIYKGD